ncbi:MAG TPA: ROK family protein [Panacibacter sp.]|nr:ROK family protein [Panacibacter sp.]
MTSKLLPLFKQFNPTGLSSIAIKDLTRKRKIVSQMSSRDEITINDISESLNISIPKTSELLNDLAEGGFIKETSKRSVGQGRKASFYALRADNYYFLGVEIKKYKINIGLMGFDKIIVHYKIDIPFFYKEAGESLKEIIHIINVFLDETKIERNKIIGVGLSVAGRINVKTGNILTIYHFGDAPVKDILETELGLPVYLDNDSRTIAYGEFNFGKRSLEKEVLILNLDYGIALGIFVNGKPVYGASGYAGELGHIPLFDNEKICFCGKKGCLETEASGMALIERLTEQMNKGSNSILQPLLQKKGFLELEDILDAVTKGDSLTLQTINTIAERLGRGLAVTINIFNPELIIIGGLLAAAGEPLLLPVKNSIIMHSLSLVSNDTNVVLSGLNNKAGLLGCCLLVRDKILGLIEV